MKLSTLVYRIPVIGWMIESAMRGSVSEKVFFLLNLVMIWAFAGLFFGLPAVFLPAVAFAIGFLIFLVFFTASDLVEAQVEARADD